jgi:hypothetical protein
VLFAAPRFRDGILLLERLRDRARTDAALLELQPAEAEMLADRLLSRWTELDEKHLPPSIMLSRSSDRRVVLSHSGLEPGYEVIWEGSIAEGRVTVRIHGRARRDGRRCILVDQI